MAADLEYLTASGVIRRDRQRMKDEHFDEVKRIFYASRQMLIEMKSAAAFGLLLAYAEDKAVKAMAALIDLPAGDAAKLLELQVEIRAARMVGQFLETTIKMAEKEGPPKPADRHREQ